MRANWTAVYCYMKENTEDFSLCVTFNEKVLLLVGIDFYLFGMRLAGRQLVICNRNSLSV